ncbi:MAG: Glu-tRNA(Gln) amidotransferase subunit GatE [archaeon]
MIEYETLGFMCGIEIHQQLEGKKLFCGCPTIIRKDKPDYSIRRELRVSSGEMGGVDAAAKHEQSKEKHFIYQGYHGSTCMVENDEEPPHPVNPVALQAAIQICSMIHATVVDEVQFMRKTVIDGSNTSGFQRTALVGVDGYIEVMGKKISVPTICLEEEACQVVERGDDKDVYNLSRLGIPLIEIGTGPEIENAEMAKEAAAQLGMVLRSTGKCKRGIGSIRQDVNISIKGGARTEVKGFQDLKSIPAVIEGEVKRQLSEIKKGKSVQPQVRKAEPDFSTTFLRPMPGADRMYPETDIPPIRVGDITVEKIELLDDKVARLAKKHKVPAEMVRIIVKKDMPFEDLVSRYPRVAPLLVAEYLVSVPKEVRKRFSVEADPLVHAEDILGRLGKGEITKESVCDILAALGKGETVDFSKYTAVDDSKVDAVIAKVVEKHKGAPIGALMGEAMKELRGKADGKTVMDKLRKSVG